MSVQRPTTILHGTRFEAVEAVLLDGITPGEALTVDNVWMPYLANLLGEAERRGIPENEWPEHYHWNWWRKNMRMPATARHLGLSCADKMQGMMILLTSGKTSRLARQANKPLVYIDYVATAPWNLRGFLQRLGRVPEYREVGRVLMTEAIRISQELGYEGRIGLESLPQTESFYANTCKMIDTGAQSYVVPQGVYELRCYEMTPEIARDFVR